MCSFSYNKIRKCILAEYSNSALLHFAELIQQMYVMKNKISVPYKLQQAPSTLQLPFYSSLVAFTKLTLPVPGWNCTFFTPFAFVFIEIWYILRHYSYFTKIYFCTIIWTSTYSYFKSMWKLHIFIFIVDPLMYLI